LKFFCNAPYEYGGDMDSMEEEVILPIEYIYIVIIPYPEMQEFQTLLTQLGKHLNLMNKCRRNISPTCDCFNYILIQYIVIPIKVVNIKKME